MGIGLFPLVKPPQEDVYQRPPSGVKVKEMVELYLERASEISRLVLG
jgi:hypothetical protein